jgi:hypothetical protein
VAPIRFVAELIGAERDSELAIRWLIALTVLCATSCYRFDGSGSGTEVNPTLQEVPAESGNAASWGAQVFSQSEADRPSLYQSRHS